MVTPSQDPEISEHVLNNVVLYLIHAVPCNRDYYLGMFFERGNVLVIFGG